MKCRRTFGLMMLVGGLALVACGRLPHPAADSAPAIDLGDPDVGGGAGEETGPQTPIPPATATGEASPRLDATAVAEATFPPTPAPATSEPTVEPTIAPSAEPTLSVEPSPTAPEPTAASEAPTTTTEAPATPEVSPTPQPQTNEAGEVIHTVQPGENLYRIGLQYGLSWVVIAAYNGITDPNAITVGQEIRIPPATPTATAEAATTDDGPQTTAEQQTTASGPSSAGASAVITVSPGDTVYAIAQRHGVSWDQVAEANGLSAPNQIYVGQMLKIPADVPGPAQSFTHRVHSGDTLAAIARQYGLTAAALADANGLSAPYVIFPGQEIAIPGEE